MLIRLVQSFLLILLISCSSEFNNTSNVVKIDDSYFFQKEKYYISFFSCDQPQNQLANIRSTIDNQHFIEISTIDSQELDIEGCTKDTFALNELTPQEGNPFANEFLIDIQGEKIKAVVIDEPAFDSNNDRLKS